jgi:hypothetical protein
VSRDVELRGFALTQESGPKMGGEPTQFRVHGRVEFGKSIDTATRPAPPSIG